MSFAYPRIEGFVSYKNPKGAEIGREGFAVHRLPNARVTRAWCEMDEKNLVRDATWTVDDNWMPIDGFVRVSLGGRIAGQCAYRFEGHNKVYCDSHGTPGPISGHMSQVLTSEKPYQFLGLHPLIADGQICAVRGTTAPGETRSINAITCSYSPDGETGLTGLPIDIKVVYFGPEEVTVPAGKFKAEKFGIVWQPQWPPAMYWVTPGDFIFLKETWSISGLTCELSSLRVTGAN